MIIVGSSFSGAALVMDGAAHLTPFLAFPSGSSGAATIPSDRRLYRPGRKADMGWQFVNLRRWVGAAASASANRFGRAASCASTAFATTHHADDTLRRLAGLWRQQFILSVSQGLDREVCPMYIFYGMSDCQRHLCRLLRHDFYSGSPWPRLASAQAQSEVGGLPPANLT